MFFSTSSLEKIFADQNYLLVILEWSSHGVVHAVEFTPSSFWHMLPPSSSLLIVLDLDLVHCFASHSLHSPHFPHWQSAKYNYTICCNWKWKLFLLNKKTTYPHSLGNLRNNHHYIYDRGFLQISFRNRDQYHIHLFFCRSCLSVLVFHWWNSCILNTNNCN